MGGRRKHTQNHWGTSPKPSITLIPKRLEAEYLGKVVYWGTSPKQKITKIERAKSMETE